jgi:chemotaxis regulatin CheY-phosphate phosphatase CheZ
MASVSTPAEKLQAMKEELGRLDKALHDAFLDFQENQQNYTKAPEESEAVKKRRDDLNYAIIRQQQVADGDACEECVARDVVCKPSVGNGASNKCEQCTILGTKCSFEGA